MKIINHILILLVILLPLIWGIYGYFKTKKEPRSSISLDKKTSLNLIINMAVLYALAYNIIFFIQELFLALGKKWLGLTAYLYNNNHDWDGSHSLTALAQGYGAVAIFIFGLIFFLLSTRTSKTTQWLHVFYLWLGFQGLAQSIPQFVTASMFPETDTGQAFAYLGVSKGLGLFISIVGVAGLLYLGTKMSVFLVRLAPAQDYISTGRQRFGYLFRSAVIPSFVAVILIVPFLIMPWERALNPLFLTLNAIPVIFAHGWKINLSQAKNNAVHKKILWVPIVLLLMLLVFFRTILVDGIVLN